MKTMDWTSKAILLKNLSMILLQVCFELELANTVKILPYELKNLLQSRWNAVSGIVNVTIEVYESSLDCGYMCVELHITDNPIVLASISIQL